MKPGTSAGVAEQFEGEDAVRKKEQETAHRQDRRTKAKPKNKPKRHHREIENSIESEIHQLLERVA